MNELFVKKIKIEKFKGVDHLELNFNKKMNVIIGVNGSGKSTILFALAMALSRFIGRIRSLSSNGIIFDKSYIKNGSPSSAIDVEMTYAGQDIAWKIAKQRHQTKQTISSLDEINTIVKNVNEHLSQEPNYSIPIVVLYGVGRNVLDIPLRIREKHIFEQLAAYDGALLNERHINDFRLFFEWFRNREDIENEKIREFAHNIDASGPYMSDLEVLDDNGNSVLDSQLKAVRTAIQKIIPDFEELRIKRNPLRMVLTKHLPYRDEELDVTQLSDGEKCTLAMVGDLARRLSIANPGLKNPIEGEGIVMIDEIDLHLHPQWECDIMSKLHETFPNCQFIVSTHSPLVLSQLEPEQIFVLSYDEDKIKVEHPPVAQGLTSNEILHLLMNAPYMSPEMKKKLDELYAFIENEKWAKAAKLIVQLRKESRGNTPEITKAETYMSLCKG